MIDWSAAGGIGGACGGAGAILGVLIGHMNVRSKEFKEQIAESERIKEAVKKIPHMEGVLDRHLLECAAANARSDAEVLRLRLDVTELAREVRALLEKG